MTNVISLTGDALPNEPVPEVVSLLEQMLQEAKAGRLRGVAYVAVRDVFGSGMHVMEGWKGGLNIRNELAMGIMMLQYSFAQAVDEQQTEDSSAFEPDSA